MYLRVVILGTVSGLLVVLIPLTEWIPHSVFGRRSKLSKLFMKRNKKKWIKHVVDKCFRTYLMLPVAVSIVLLLGMFMILNKFNILDHFAVRISLWFIAKAPVIIFIYLTWVRENEKVENGSSNLFMYLLFILLLVWVTMRCVSSGASRFGQIQISFQDGNLQRNFGGASLIVAALIVILFYIKLWHVNNYQIPKLEDTSRRNIFIKYVIVGSFGVAVMVYISVHNFDILFNEKAIFSNTVSIASAITPLMIFIVLFSLVVMMDGGTNTDREQKNILYIYKTTMIIYILFVFDGIAATGVKLAAQAQVIHNEVSRMFSNELPIKWCEDIGVECGPETMLSINSMLINVSYWVTISEFCSFIMKKLSSAAVGSTLTLSLKFGCDLFVLTCTAIVFMGYDVDTVEFFVAAVVEIVVVLVFQLHLLNELHFRIPGIPKLLENRRKSIYVQTPVEKLISMIENVISAKYSISALIMSRTLMVMIILFTNSETNNASSFLGIVAVRYPFRKISCYLFQIALGVVAHNAMLAWYSQKLRNMKDQIPKRLKSKTVRQFRRKSLGLNFILSTFSNDDKTLLFTSYTLSNHLNIVDKQLTWYLCTFSIFGLSHFFLAYHGEYNYQQSKLSNNSGSIYNSTYFRALLPNNWDPNSSIARNWSLARYQCLCRIE